ncbi:MAG: hypothetical protein HXY48_15095 [Ignavibacteriaceae bacterium]|nr:hypothetical protein [Ignavibacteriaceae bacterium]
MNILPENLNTLFWDINVQNFDPADYPEYTISRILEYGDENAFAWLKANFSENQIARVIKTNKQLSKKSSNFWAIVYKIPANEIASLTNNVSAV